MRKAGVEVIDERVVRDDSFRNIVQWKMPLWMNAHSAVLRFNL
jgi:hypothetical protein